MLDNNHTKADIPELDELSALVDRAIIICDAFEASENNGEAVPDPCPEWEASMAKLDDFFEKNGYITMGLLEETREACRKFIAKYQN